MADETVNPTATPAASAAPAGEATTPSTPSSFPQRTGSGNFGSGNSGSGSYGSGGSGSGGSSSGGGQRSSGPRPPRPAGGPGGGPGGRKFFRRKKVCKFTVEKIDTISYRDVRLLQQFVSDRGKIIPRRLSGTSAPFQRKLTRAIKQARAIALLPYAAKY